MSTRIVLRGFMIVAAISPEFQASMRPDVLCEEALVWLDGSGSQAQIDDSLLSAEAASAMRIGIRKAMVLIAGLDPGEMLGRQRWFDKLTGADVEARLRFELSAKQINLAFDALKGAAARSRMLLASMATERQRIAGEQEALADALAYAQVLAGRRSEVDAFLLERFDRRFANLGVMQSANAMAIEQFRLAENGLKAMLDRYTDIATVVIPLWQQHLFAILHAPGRLRESDPNVADFVLCHSALGEYFTGESRS